MACTSQNNAPYRQQAFESLRVNRMASDWARIGDSTSPQKKRCIEVASRFVDLEAAVDEEEEDFDVEGETLQGLLDDEELDDDEPDTHRQLLNEFETQQEDVNVGWQNFILRAHNRGSDDNYDGHNLLEDQGPTSQDYRLYEVPCQLGQEETAVLRILRAFISWNPSTESPVRSALTRSCLPGRIFIEAVSNQMVINVATQFDVLKQNEVKVLPIEEAHLCLLGGDDQYTPSAYSWVRLRKRPYQSDIAFIRAVDLRSLCIDVVLVPRLSYGRTVKRKRGNRPEQRLLNPDDILQKCGHKAIVKRNFRWMYKGDSYSENGYLFLNDVDTAFYSPKHCLPTMVELEMFEECEEIPFNIFVATAKKIAALTLREGDRVQILAGDCIGLSGEFRTRTENEADVYLPLQDVVISLPLTDLQRHFKQGDNVEVIAGSHKGLIGFVMKCSEQSLSLYIPDTVKEVEVCSWRVVFRSTTPMFGVTPSLTKKHPTTACVREGTHLHEGKCQNFDKLVRLKSDPNESYQGQQVIILNGNFKGYLGQIISSGSDETVLVEINATMRKERFNFSDLSLSVDKRPLERITPAMNNSKSSDTPSESVYIRRRPIHRIIQNMNNSKSSDTSSKSVYIRRGPIRRIIQDMNNSKSSDTSSKSVYIHPDPPKTPLPQIEDIPADAAWDPSSGSPGNTNDFACYWLSNDCFKGIRICLQIMENNVPPEYLAYKNDTLEFIETKGHMAVVRYRKDKKNIPMQYLVPVHPDMKLLLVTAISGEAMGKVFRIVAYGPEECKIRDISIQPIRAKKDLFMATTNLVQVYPERPKFSKT